MKSGGDWEDTAGLGGIGGRTAPGGDGGGGTGFLISGSLEGGENLLSSGVFFFSGCNSFISSDLLKIFMFIISRFNNK
jgi:hypothetical protein